MAAVCAAAGRQVALVSGAYNKDMKYDIYYPKDFKPHIRLTESTLRFCKRCSVEFMGTHSSKYCKACGPKKMRQSH